MIVNRKHTSASHGFTLLEMVLVILIIGVISMTVVTPTKTQVPMRLQYEARRVLNDIRYAQALSMASGQRYRWVLTSSSTYQITNEAGSAIMLANGSTTLTLSAGVTIASLSNLPNSLIAFDSAGAPYITSTYPGTALATTATIPVTSGGQTRNITVLPTTGYGALA
jgi:prepilin-type N-terminal cleavage/methylation domain-containing protein